MSRHGFKRSCIAAVGTYLLMSLTSFAAHAQGPRAKTVEPNTTATLSQEKQEQVKAFVRDYERRSKDGSKLPRVDRVLAPGEAVPEDVTLATMAEDSFTEVPQVTSYRFALSADGTIAVVDPATRQVVQVIRP